jgi:hypothetical protein
MCELVVWAGAGDGGPAGEPEEASPSKREQYTNTGGSAATLTEHWNGRKWSKVASPGPSPGEENTLLGVSTLAPRDAWAVGGSGTTLGLRTMLVCWNGRAWNWNGR